MCAVHGWDAPCKCGYAIFAGLALAGCAAFASVTPADRAKAYSVEAATARAECKAYEFDRAAGLVTEVPAMARLCADQ
jgi:hypothetical protein